MWNIIFSLWSGTRLENKSEAAFRTCLPVGYSNYRSRRNITDEEKVKLTKEVTIVGQDFLLLVLLLVCKILLSLSPFTLFSF